MTGHRLRTDCPEFRQNCHGKRLENRFSWFQDFLKSHFIRTPPKWFLETPAASKLSLGGPGLPGVPSHGIFKWQCWKHHKIFVFVSCTSYILNSVETSTHHSENLSWRIAEIGPRWNRLCGFVFCDLENYLTKPNLSLQQRHWFLDLDECPPIIGKTSNNTCK